MSITRFLCGINGVFFKCFNIIYLIQNSVPNYVLQELPVIQPATFALEKNSKKCFLFSRV